MDKSLGLGKIKVPKTYDALAEILRQRIVQGDFVAGEPLPSERGLVLETGLSRGSVREALRMLEAEGLIETKTGRYGGAIAKLPNYEAISRHVSLFVRSHKVPITSLIDARCAIEPMLAFLAAQHRTPDDITRLELACERLEAADVVSDKIFAERNFDWHYCVASASHNELLIAFLSSIAKAMLHLHETHTREFNESAEVRRAVQRAHRAVTASIVRGQPEAARRGMERHLGAYSLRVTTLPTAEIDLA